MGLSAQLSLDGSELRIVIDGRFDYNVHTDFKDSYRNLSPEIRYVIELSQATYIDSSALGMLLLLREYAGENDADIRLLNCSPDLRKIFSVSNMDKIFVME